ncbi:hypothetical protein RICGR_1401 [Rickettsiella grylli]|uniref:Uncharacterized protein n=1 Tax=Rickettsiella grylli TaxID=59196 RepID=A8PPZ3_9COXI|nr:hypothetical protein RICGR_1401 [Rickettsiella grylli]
MLFQKKEIAKNNDLAYSPQQALANSKNNINAREFFFFN